LGLGKEEGWRTSYFQQKVGKKGTMKGKSSHPEINIEGKEKESQGKKTQPLTTREERKGGELTRLTLSRKERCEKSESLS